MCGGATGFLLAGASVCVRIVAPRNVSWRWLSKRRLALWSEIAQWSRLVSGQSSLKDKARQRTRLVSGAASAEVKPHLLSILVMHDLPLPLLGGQTSAASTLLCLYWLVLFCFRVRRSGSHVIFRAHPLCCGPFLHVRTTCWF